MNLSHNIFASLGVVALLSTPAFSYIEFTRSGTSAKSYIDLAASSPIGGHMAWGMWVPPNRLQDAPSDTKKYNIELSGGSVKCYLIHFTTGATPANNADLRLWTGDGRSIDDDGPGTLLPKARIWTSGAIQITVSAYSPSYNSIDAWQVAESLAATSASACDDGVLPFYNDDTGQITRQNNLAN